MSIRKEDGEYICECDDCGDQLFGGTTEDFKEFVEQIKDERWKIRKDGDDWTHICPTCTEVT